MSDGGNRTEHDPKISVSEENADELANRVTKGLVRVGHGKRLRRRLTLLLIGSLILVGTVGGVLLWYRYGEDLLEKFPTIPVSSQRSTEESSDH